MTASTIYIQDMTDYPSASDLYLSGPGTPYSGSGAPWTAQATSPYTVSMNDVTGGIWTPQAPPRTDILSGTPPFSPGSSLAFRGYGDVETEIGIQMYAATDGLAINLLNRLRRVLGCGAGTPPPQLRITPGGSGVTITYSIIGGTVQETPSFLNQESGNAVKVIRAVMRLTLKSFGVQSGTAESVLSGASMSVAGTGSPNNLAAFTAGQGELTSEGSPVQVGIQTGAIRPTRLYLATARGRIYDATGAATLTTSSTTGITSNLGAPAVYSYRPFPGLRMCILAHASVASNAQFRIELLVAPGIQQVYATPWVSSTGGVAQLIYCGAITLDGARRTEIDSYAVRIRYRSTNGSSASVVLTSMQYVFAHTFCVVNPDYTNGLSVSSMYVKRFNATGVENGRAVAPYAYGMLSGARTNLLEMRGSAPLYYVGASLFVAFVTGATGLYTPADTMTVDVLHAPQYHTIGGNPL